MRHAVIPGWFSVLDTLTLVAIDEEQRQGCVVGDILEVGAYLGKSAILLGYLLRERERLTVIDLFGEPAATREQRAEQRGYSGLTRAAFEKNYDRFHSTRPIVLQGESDHHLSSLHPGRSGSFMSTGHTSMRQSEVTWRRRRGSSHRTV